MNGSLYADGRLEEVTPAHRALTFPAFRGLLAERVASGEWIGAEARFAGVPVGLALAGASLPHAKLISLVVHADFQNAGVGFHLLRRLCGLLERQGAIQLSATYRSDLSSRAALDGVLSAMHFEESVLDSLCCEGRIDDEGGDRLLALPQRPAFSVAPWREVRETVAMDDDWIPRDLDPRVWGDNFEPLTSAALLHHGQLAGWLVTHQIAPDLLRCTSGYVNPSLQRAGGFLHLLAHMIRGQREAFPGSRVIWTIPARHTATMRFAKTRLQPVGLAIHEFRRRVLELQPASSHEDWRRVLSTASREQTLARAQAGLGRKTIYQLGEGGWADGIAGPLAPKCDCSGFVCWALGVPRELPPGSNHWLNTDGIWAGGTGLFHEVPRHEAAPGDLLVHPSDSDHRHGHIGVILEVEAGISMKLLHCSRHNHSTTGDAVRVTSPAVIAKNPRSRIMRVDFSRLRQVAG